MEIRIDHPAFMEHRLSVRANSFFKPAELLLDGRAVPPVDDGRAVFVVEDDSGAQHGVVFTGDRIHFDRFPIVHVSGHEYRLERKLAGHEWLWCLVPIGVGVTGGILGVAFAWLAARLNASILRSGRPAVARYSLGAGVWALCAAGFWVSAVTFHLLLGAAAAAFGIDMNT